MFFFVKKHIASAKLLALRFLGSDGVDDPDHPDWRHDYGLVYANGSCDGRRHLVAVPLPRALPHHDGYNTHQSQLRRNPTASALFIVTAASIFSWLLTVSQAATVFSNFIFALTDNKWVFLILVNVLMLLVGCFLDTIAAITILVPILLPVATRYGVDPVHFGLIMTLNLMIGLLHPPLGMVLFVLSRVAKLSVERTTMAILPWLVPLVLALLLITFEPAITLWLPQQVGLIR
jgi:TRAP-type C4-dicarboxylate transport system permease large subunit